MSQIPCIWLGHFSPKFIIPPAQWKSIDEIYSLASVCWLSSILGVLGNETCSVHTPSPAPQPQMPIVPCRTFLTVVNVTESAAEKAQKWNWSLPKVIANWLHKNEVRARSHRLHSLQPWTVPFACHKLCKAIHYGA